MNILFTKFPLESHFGGGEKHTIQLAEGLVHQGHTCIFLGSDPILLKVWQEHDWSHYPASVGPEPTSVRGVLLFTFRSPLTFLQFGYWLLKLKQKYAITAIYAQSLTEKLLLTPWAWLFDMRMFWMEHLQIERWLIKNPYRIFYVLWSNVVTIVTVSNGVSAQLAQLGVKKKNIKVIYNGIDVNEFLPQSRPSHEHIVLGTVARLSIEKDVASVIRAVALLKEKDIRVIYRIAGTGDQLESLQQLAEELGVFSEVEFLGFTKEVKQFLQSIDLFVLASFRRESFGIAAAEAMAMERPAIVTDTVGLNEVVSDKETGLIVEAHNPQAIADAIKYFVDHPDEITSMGKAARKRVIDNFNLELMIKQFSELFAH
jgi:glycosyltransferase involved in cell wall biosynthesis